LNAVGSLEFLIVASLIDAKKDHARDTPNSS
jgi:hypothetical protein